MKQNNRCSILFHFDVPGGKCDTCISSPVVSANSASCVFHRCSFEPLLPPPSQLTGTEIYKSGILVDIVYTVWRNSTKFFDQKIMIQNLTRIILFPVFLTVVLEVSKVLFFESYVPWVGEYLKP